MEHRYSLLKNGIKKIEWMAEKGSMLVEILVAIALMTGMVVYSWRLTNVAARISNNVGNEVQANALANEYIEMARSRRDEGWSSMFFEDDTGGFLESGEEDPEYVPPPAIPVVFGDPYHFVFDDVSTNLFLLPGEVSVTAFGEEDVDGFFTRSIVIEQVRRDAVTNEITTDINDPIDDESLQISVLVSWYESGKTKSIEKNMYLTNWYGF